MRGTVWDPILILWWVLEEEGEGEDFWMISLLPLPFHGGSLPSPFHLHPTLVVVISTMRHEMKRERKRRVGFFLFWLLRNWDSFDRSFVVLLVYWKVLIGRIMLIILDYNILRLFSPTANASNQSFKWARICIAPITTSTGSQTWTGWRGPPRQRGSQRCPRRHPRRLPPPPLRHRRRRTPPPPPRRQGSLRRRRCPSPPEDTNWKCLYTSR